jgi:hypothetical protein
MRENQNSRRSVRPWCLLVAAAVAGSAPGCLMKKYSVDESMPDPGSDSGGGLTTIALGSSKVDKVDLLLMVDNSSGMGDKQTLLADAVPDIVNRLVSPWCVNAIGEGKPASNGACQSGYQREFEPITDIHIGIISSSIGGHGADSCSNNPQNQYNPRQEDMSHLIARNDAYNPNSTEATWAGKGFLVWDAQARHSPPGDTDLGVLIPKFSKIILGTGQDGCGFEASLEAWYRFLVEPAPYVRMVQYSCATNQPEEGGDCRGPEGVDTVVLQQRADFLRADSLLAVVMLTDENDCSVVDGWQNYIAVQSYAGTMPWHLPRATSACQSDPAGTACMSCAQGDHSGDPECSKGGYSDEEDSLNLRCYRQKQRFGIDFLYPVRRYVNGLSKVRFSKEDVSSFVNPGFAAGDLNPAFCPHMADPSNCATLPRDQKLVFLTAIVGVPWQDIAIDPTDLKKGFRPVAQFDWNRAQFESSGMSLPPGVDGTANLWNVILGRVNLDPQSKDYLQIDPSPSGEPLDPLMIESVDPRSGTNPATGAPLAGASAGTPNTNLINGHEWDIQGRNDLQYACIFKILPRDCTNNPISCDCAYADGANNPLCQTDSGGYGTTQYRAKAYPGRRQLAVVKGLDPGQAVVASICPAETTYTGGADYGYRPAVNAMVDRFRSALSGRDCLKQELQYGDDWRVPCLVVEASMQCGQCTAPERRELDPGVAAQIQSTLDQYGLQCACEIPQAEPGDPITQCIEADAPAGDGWCYVDPSYHNGANTNIVTTCPSTQKRTIRFMGTGYPKAASKVFLVCQS